MQTENKPITEIRLEQLKKDCETHGIIFNFKDKDKMKTGIIRKGQYKDGIFLNGFIPQYRRLTRKERRSL